MVLLTPYRALLVEDLLRDQQLPGAEFRRHDERRHAGSASNIENYGANHAHGLN